MQIQTLKRHMNVELPHTVPATLYPILLMYSRLDGVCISDFHSGCQTATGLLKHHFDISAQIWNPSNLWQAACPHGLHIA